MHIVCTRPFTRSYIMRRTKGKSGQPGHVLVITTLAGDQVTWEPGQGLPRVEPRGEGYVVVLQQQDGPEAAVELTPVLPGSAAYGVQGGLIAARARGYPTIHIANYL